MLIQILQKRLLTLQRLFAVRMNTLIQLVFLQQNGQSTSLSLLQLQNLHSSLVISQVPQAQTKTLGLLLMV